ncbi:hypothetical protein RP20_CCG023927 [Aedes albopictus]|nr:hypothetical protein RP20_CCG023927 [Aedes albopictus]
MWMCEDCQTLMENMRFRSTVNAARALETPDVKVIESIRSEIANLSEMVNQLNGTIGTLKTSFHVPSNAASCDALLSPPKDVSPLSSTKIAPDVSMSTADRIEDRVEVPDGRNETFKLYLSNIAVDVSEDEVKRMVSDALCVNEVYAINCLKPTWKDASSLDFISFKVEIDKRCRDKALNSLTWPKGIRCREFKEHTETTWRPDRFIRSG